MTDPYRPWDLEDFGPKLRDWQQAAQPPDEVYALMAKWVESRRDNPYDGYRRHDEAMFGETFWRSQVKDEHQRPLMCHGREVWCYYSVHENANAQEKRVVCEAFLSV